MLALEPRVVDALWAGLQPRLPVREEVHHPLGCHRARIADREVFEAVLFRLVTGCSWDVAGRLGKGGETTLRTRYNEWNAQGAFDALVTEAIEGYDRIVGVDLSDASVDASLPQGALRRARAPAKALLTEANQGGSGRCCATGAVFLLAGPPTAPTATTRHCSSPPWPPQSTAGCFATSRPCTSTAAMPGTRYAASVTTSASTTSYGPPNAAGALPAANPGPSRWECAGPSNAPTRGYRTSANYAAAPTATPKHASDNSHWPSP